MHWSSLRFRVTPGQILCSTLSALVFTVPMTHYEVVDDFEPRHVYPTWSFALRKWIGFDVPLLGGLSFLSASLYGRLRSGRWTTPASLLPAGSVREGWVGVSGGVSVLEAASSTSRLLPLHRQLGGLAIGVRSAVATVSVHGVIVLWKFILLKHMSDVPFYTKAPVDASLDATEHARSFHPIRKALPLDATYQAPWHAPEELPHWLRAGQEAAPYVAPLCIYLLGVYSMGALFPLFLWAHFVGGFLFTIATELSDTDSPIGRVLQLVVSDEQRYRQRWKSEWMDNYVREKARIRRVAEEDPILSSTTDGSHS